MPAIFDIDIKPAGHGCLLTTHTARGGKWVRDFLPEVPRTGPHTVVIAGEYRAVVRAAISCSGLSLKG